MYGQSSGKFAMRRAPNQKFSRFSSSRFRNSTKKFPSRYSKPSTTPYRRQFSSGRPSGNLSGVRRTGWKPPGRPLPKNLCFRCGSKDHWAKDCKISISTKCSICGKTGHSRAACFKARKSVRGRFQPFAHLCETDDSRFWDFVDGIKDDSVQDLMDCIEWDFENPEADESDSSESEDDSCAKVLSPEE